jgi:hypothetical protein
MSLSRGRKRTELLRIVDSDPRSIVAPTARCTSVTQNGSLISSLTFGLPLQLSVGAVLLPEFLDTDGATRHVL